MQHFRDFEKQVNFVMNLVSILKVTDLTQENVSCLNTSLVSFYLYYTSERNPSILEMEGSRKA